MAFLSQLLLLGLGTFLMIVVLLQRGRGGGLAGAFGGLGGQSAFGTKAGDVFTRITIVLAVCWVIVAGGSGYFLRAGAEQRASGLGEGGAEVSSDGPLEGEADFDPGATPPGATPGTTPAAEGGADADDAADPAPGAAAPAAEEGAAPADAPAQDGADSAATPQTDAPPEANDTPAAPESPQPSDQ